jgi:hypothetical protein
MVVIVILSLFFLLLKSVRLGRLIKNINQLYEGYYKPLTGKVPKAIMMLFSFSSLK